MKYAVFIPSIGRPDRCARVAEAFESREYPVYVVTQPAYATAYYSAIPRDSILLTLPPYAIPGIAPARDFIIQYAAEKGFDSIIMSDDDITIAKRFDDGSSITLKKEPGSYSALAILLLMKAMSKNNALASVRRRLFSNLQENVELPTRLVAINLKRILDTAAKYTFAGPLTVCEDYYIALYLLSKGYGWEIASSHTVSDSCSNAPGGCSTFRNPSIQTECAKRLEAEFPEWVKAVKKTSGNFGSCLNPRFNRKKLAEDLLAARENYIKNYLT